MNADPARPRRPSGGFGARMLRSGAYALAGLALLGATTLAGLRILLPELGHHRPAVEQWLSGIAGRQVELGTIDVHWRGWTPVFRVEDVRIAGGGATGDTRTDPSIRLASLTFSIDPLALLRSGALRPREISASGASLVVVRRADGTFAVEKSGELRPAGPREDDLLAQWIPGRANISLSGSRILWIDEQYGTRALPLQEVALRLEHAGGGHRLSGSFELPEAGRIDFATEWSAGDSPTAPWTGTAYVAAREVDVARLDLDTRQLGAEELSGVFSGSMWSTWNGGRIVEAEGTIHVQSPRIMHAGRWRGFDEVSASFKVERTPEGWTLAARDLAVATPGGSWPQSSVDAKWATPGEGREGSVAVSAEFARIEDLVALAAPGGDAPASPVWNALVEADPHGVLDDLRVWAPLTDRIHFERARARGGFSAMRLDPKAWPVSLTAASGRFEAGGHGFVIDVASAGLRVDDPRWLARPLPGEELAGAFGAFPSADGIRFRLEDASLATPAGVVTGGGGLFVPRDDSEPRLSATFSLGASKIAAVRTLVPTHVLPEPVARWIDSAAPEGEIREARLTLRGRLSEMSFGAGKGTIEATAELALPVLRYAPGWPEITNVTGVVRFDGRRVDARVESGRIFASAIREADVIIEDPGVEAPVVNIAGSIEGASADAVRFLAESPLPAGLASAIDGVAVHGDSRLDLGLVLTFAGGAPSVSVEGRVSLDDNRVELPGLARGPEAVNGVVAFRGDTVESDGLTATWLGEPLHVAVGPAPESAYATRLSISGRMTPRLLASGLFDAGFVDSPLPGDSALLARLLGDAAWTATLDVPRTGGGRPVRLRMAVDLTGVAFDLPPPFGKGRGTPRMLRIDSRITPGVERIVAARYGDLAGMVLRLVPDTDRFRLDRGTIRLGAGDATLPDTPGVTVQGVLPELDVGVWDALVEDVTARRASSADPPPFGVVRNVSLEAGSLSAIGTRFPATRIQAARDPDGGWRLDLDGLHLKGVVRIPGDPRAGPVTTDFERFVYEPGSAGPGNEWRGLDPRTMPAVSFSARRFVLGERDLGHVTFTVAPAEHGMELERLEVRAEAFRGEATGTWSVAGGEHRTEFVMRTHGDDLGQLISSLGFDGAAVAGGTADLSLRGSWKGMPADFALRRLTGVMHFLSTDGRLTRLERGVTGRVFGLLTFTSLPRRFILDFGDLFRGGFEYDRIEGSFAIENGHAHTDDLFMESDTARLEVVGRTGLVDEDYDKLVTVIPKISSNLLLLPVWVAEKILDRNVFDKAFAYQYTITGGWDEPVVELVSTRRRQEHESR